MKNSALFHWYKREKRLILGLSVCIIAALLVVFSQALEREMARAEEAAFKTVMAELNAILAYKTAEKMAQNKRAEIKNFVNHNPMEWMKSTPVNYSGVQDDSTQVAPGHWFFAKAESAIVYRVINTDMIKITGTDDAEFIRFRVVLEYVDSNNNQQYDESVDRVVGLELEPLQIFQWLAIDAGAAS